MQTGYYETDDKSIIALAHVTRTREEDDKLTIYLSDGKSFGIPASERGRFAGALKMFLTHL